VRSDLERNKPLQVRWPSDDVKAAKLATIQLQGQRKSDTFAADDF
jgi:hypothetical protein